MSNGYGRSGRHGIVAAVLCGVLAWQAASAAEPATQAQHPVGCDAYDPDIALELKLLPSPESKIAAAPTDAQARLEAGKAYIVTLAAQTGVQLAIPPRRHVLEEGAFAGLVGFEVPEDGTWRVSLSKESWAEVVGPDGAAVRSSRFQGREGCPAMRKMVEFPLRAGVAYTLQLSGGTDPEIGVLVTGPLAAGP